MTTFSVDYDGTFTADPELWQQIVPLMKARGHCVIMTSQRCAKYAGEMKAAGAGIFDAIVYASGQTKEDAARASGYEVDVWVDDSPYSVLTALVYRGCEDQGS